MVCVQGRPHTVPVLLPVVPMKTAMGHRSVAVMAVVPGVWNQVRINEMSVPLRRHCGLVVSVHGWSLE